VEKAKYQGAIEAFNKVMESFAGGHDDAKARSSAQRCIMDIKVAAGDMSSDNYFREVVHRLEWEIDELFSARKHLKYRIGSRRGVDELRSRILSDIYRLRGWPDMKAGLKGLP